MTWAALGWVQHRPGNPKIQLPGTVAPEVGPAVPRTGGALLLGVAGGANFLPLPLCHASATGSLPLGLPPGIGDFLLLPAFLV